MAEDFDPYYKWLGIPPKDQPPHFYRLLGIELFEADPEVIALAAEQRLRHVRSFQSGEYAIISQKLQKKIAAAKAYLLNPEKKREYDISLRLQLRIQQAQSQPPLPTPQNSLPPALLDQITPQPGESNKRSNPLIAVKESFDLLWEFLRPHKRVMKTIAKLMCGAVGVVIILLVFAHGKDLWNYTFNKTSDLIGKLTSSSAEKPPERQVRIRNIPGAGGKGPANSSVRQNTGESSAAAGEENPDAANAGAAGAVPPPPAPDAIQTSPADSSSNNPPAATVRNPLTDPSQTTAPEIISLNLPSGKTFKSRIFKVNVNQILDLLKDSAKDEQVLFLDDPSGRISAFTEYKKSALDGVFVSFNEFLTPMIYATYAEGKLDGMIKTWNEKNERVYWCQYVNGVRDGFCCYFKNNSLRLLLEIDHDKVNGIHLCANGELEKSFSSIEDASADKVAKTLLDELDNLEADLKNGEDYAKKTAREENLLINRERKIATSPLKRASIQDRLHRYASSKQLLINSFWRYKGW